MSELYYLTLLRMLGCTSGSSDNAYFFGDEIAFGRDTQHLDYGDSPAFGASEPALYRHFPTKRDLFVALADLQYRWVTEGIQPRSVGDLAERDLARRRFNHATTEAGWLRVDFDPVSI